MILTPSDSRPRIVRPDFPTAKDRIIYLEEGLARAEMEIRALQRHRFAVSVFLGLSFRKRLTWLFFGARAFQPKKAAVPPTGQPTDGVSL